MMHRRREERRGNEERTGKEERNMQEERFIGEVRRKGMRERGFNVRGGRERCRLRPSGQQTGAG